MTDRTSISMSQTLKDELEDRKNYPSEPYESVLWRLIEKADDADDNEQVAQEIARLLEGQL